MESPPFETTPAGPPPLTEEQVETANFFVDACGLEEVADQELTMMGASGTVRYGLGRCAEYIEDLTPEEVKDMVLTKLNEQKKAAEAPAS